MNSTKVLRFFEHHRKNALPLVLATVYDTEGSTYSKAGDQMLINADGVYQGLLSGGCLEGDLAVRASVVLESGNPMTVSYELGGDDDEVWGLGVGCDGVMRVFLQPLQAASGYQPYANVLQRFRGRGHAVLATVIESATDTLRAGTSLMVSADGTQFSTINGDAGAAVERLAIEVLGSRQSGTRSLGIDGVSARVLFAVTSPLPRLLVLGAGHDAEPVVRFASELGWRCTVFDHRPVYIDSGDFPMADECICAPAGELLHHVTPDDFDAAIVMSHHLASDRLYLQQLADTVMAYVGLLGPRNRRARLLAELGNAAGELGDRLHGPAGLPLGGRGPGAIALAIVAELHQQFTVAASSH